MMVALSLAMQAAPAFSVVPEVQWPADYRCRVVTDAAEVLDFALNLTNERFTIDRDLFQIGARAPIDVEKAGPSLKSDKGYSRVLAANKLRQGRVFISQQGTLVDPSTSFFIDAGSREQTAGERRKQASGFCVLTARSSAKENAQ